MQTNGGASLLNLRFLTEFRSFRIFPLALVHSQLTTYNPSVAEQGGTLYFCARHSNVIVAGNRRHFGFTTALAGNAREVVNETSFGTLGIPAWGKPLESDLFQDRLPGFEDVRIFEYAGRWFGLGCRPEMAVKDGVRQLAGASMHLIAFDQGFRFAGAVGLPSPYRAAWEKNWVPFRKKDGLFVVHQPSPLIVFSLDFERRKMLPAHQGQGPTADWSASSQSPWSGMSKISWSGSSQIVPYGDSSYLGVIHRKFVFADEVIFEHAFIRIGENFETEISQAFHFLTYGVEFCAGLVVRPDEVVLSFGSHGDSRSFVATLAREDVDSLFRARG